MAKRNSGFGFLEAKHLPDEVWRKFFMRAFSARHLRSLEDHLLLCPLCQSQYLTAQCGKAPTPQRRGAPVAA